MEMLLGWAHTSLRVLLSQAHRKDGTKGVMMPLRNHTGMQGGRRGCSSRALPRDTEPRGSSYP